MNLFEIFIILEMFIIIIIIVEINLHWEQIQVCYNVWRENPLVIFVVCCIVLHFSESYNLHYMRLCHISYIFMCTELLYYHKCYRIICLLTGHFNWNTCTLAVSCNYTVCLTKTHHRLIITGRLKIEKNKTKKGWCFPSPVSVSLWTMQFLFRVDRSRPRCGQLL